MCRLMLLEDDQSLIDGLCYALQKVGFDVTIARCLQDAYIILEQSNHFDLLLLDVTLPDGNGFEICEYLRQHGSTVPIVFLTAADEETTVIRGLDIGADDYITKPFRLGELCSRIRALLRRCGQQSQLQNTLCSGPVAIDLLHNRVTLDDEPIELTNAELRLLIYLIQNKGQILTRSAILNALWDGNGNFVDDNTLSVYIRRLREKIETIPSHPKYLLTVRGIGYQWKEYTHAISL